MAPSRRQPAGPPAGDTWADFTGWAIWLDHAYELELPICWTQHEGLVHSLTALWQLWLSAYAEPDEGKKAAAGAPAAWHLQFYLPWADRWRAGNLPGAEHRQAGRAHRPYERIGDLHDGLDEHVRTVVNSRIDSTYRRSAHALGTELGSAAVVGAFYSSAGAP